MKVKNDSLPNTKLWLSSAVIIIFCIFPKLIFSQEICCARQLDSLDDLNIRYYDQALVDTIEKLKIRSLAYGDSLSYVRCLLFHGYFYHQKRMSLEYLENDKLLRKILSEFNSLPPHYDIMASNLLAACKNLKGDHFGAIRDYQEAFDDYKSSSVRNTRELIILINNLMNALGKVGDFEEAIRYSKFSLKLISDDEDALFSNNLRAKVYNSSAYSRLRNGNIEEGFILFDLARTEYKKSKISKKYKSKRLVEIYVGVADLGLLSNDVVCVQQTLDSILKYQKLAQTHLHREPELKGDLSMQLGDFFEAKFSFLRAIKLSKELHTKGSRPYLHSRLAMRLGDYYVAVDSLPEAMLEYQKSLYELDNNVDTLDLMSNPTVESISAFKQAFDVLEKKSEVARTMYERGETKEEADIAIASYMSLIALLDKMRESYINDGSKFFVAEKAYPIYDECMDFLYDVYQTYPSDTLLGYAFEVMEKNKAAILFEGLKHRHALASAALPAGLADKEGSLKSDISFYKKLLAEEQKKGVEADSAKVKELEDAIFDAQEAYTLFDNRLKTEHPEFYSIKGELTKTTQIRDVQQHVPKDGLFIEYFQGTKDIYMMGISQGEVSFHKVQDALLSASITEYRGLISTRPEGRESLDRLKELSEHLLVQLLDPVFAAHGDKANLWIVPDGQLTQIPFESLWLEEKKRYMVEDYDISYYYAVDQLLAGFDGKGDNSGKSGRLGMLCLAPEFQGPILESRSCSPEMLGKLPYAQEELKYLEAEFSGRFVGQQGVNKEDLLSYIEDYGIIHLATHACLNPEDPMLSEIHFSDGYLTNYDIENLNVNPELVVLSACNTADGEIKAGEGMISLSRGFFQAGVKSMQSSLWSVDDYASSEIVREMYAGLKQGQTKSAALRSSKVQYLKEADKLRSHPYYWSGMIQIGDTSPLFDKAWGLKQWLLLAGGLLLLGSGIVIRRRRMRRSMAA